MKKIDRFITFTQGTSRYRFLPTGDVFTFTNGPFLANQFRGNAKDGSVNNIYLRVYKEDGMVSYPLLGIKSGSRISYSESSLCQEGQIDGISYKVVFRLQDSVWFWNVTLCGKGQTVDLIYGQDLGCSTADAVYTNELYTSQYLGHSIFVAEDGFIICSRQNLPANSRTPYIQQGSIGCRSIHYSTDGLQFFGLSCKQTQIPEALSKDLPDINLQYEFAYTALQTEKIILNGTASLAFYGMFLQDHPDAVTCVEHRNEILAAYTAQSVCEDDTVPSPAISIKKEFGAPLSSLPLHNGEIDLLFPDRNLEECENGTLYSFFTPDHAHVVTREKELATERPHGTIIITPPDTENVTSSLLSSTQYMYGIFNSHVVVGNTDMHKLLSTPRGFLNLQKNSGQRLYVRYGGVYRLLNLPGLFEMGMNYSRWFYKLDDDMLIITSYIANRMSCLVLEAESRKGRLYDFIVTGQTVMGGQEYAQDVECEGVPEGLRFTLDSDAYPGLHYDLLYPGQKCIVSDDRIFFEGDSAFDETFLALSFHNSGKLRVIIKGSLTEAADAKALPGSFEEEKQEALSFYGNLTRHFRLDGKAETERISILNETVWWYAHNAMIHFAMPHGLEQPGGAAWGTRDICQGPMEFFLATQHNLLARNILLNIFAHQNYSTREWPQWFMFDRYPLNAGECHGDVIFWPLKCIADYLDITGDYDILEERIPYADEPEKTETLISHILLAISNIRQDRLIGETGLITYAGGDWDDTLQPANDELKEHLVSAWTVALAYQTFRCLSHALEPADRALSAELSELAGLIKSSFEKILIRDEVIAGFVECQEELHYMLHPLDCRTGIHYRLLPMTRSIIAELAAPPQARKNAEIIQSELKCPDGVRLMDFPAEYAGGVSHLFRRAEQAANVGREISLQYTHAHIRYIEAMAKLGEADEAWNSLFVINPVLIGHSVPNARIRQSNMYFSSSDGAYNDRYEYARDFGHLKTGSVDVKGGWRLYSSGPGIYLKQLISHIFGIRFVKEGLLLDPVLPDELDGIEMTYDCYGKAFRFRYHTDSESGFCAKDRERIIPADIIKNPYRRGSLLISQDEILDCGDTIDIYMEQK